MWNQLATAEGCQTPYVSVRQTSVLVGPSTTAQAADLAAPGSCRKLSDTLRYSQTHLSACRTFDNRISCQPSSCAYATLRHTCVLAIPSTSAPAAELAPYWSMRLDVGKKSFSQLPGMKCCQTPLANRQTHARACSISIPSFAELCADLAPAATCRRPSNNVWLFQTQTDTHL